MIIAVPKEIKSNENRVALTPAGALELTKRGHKVFIQKTAGENSGFTDAAYKKAGAKILPTIEACYKKAEMIMKVKEPIRKEYSLIKENQLQGMNQGLLGKYMGQFVKSPVFLFQSQDFFGILRNHVCVTHCA